MERRKVIFFDWDGTISMSRFWQQLENPNHSHHGILQFTDNLLFGENKDLVRSWMVGSVTSEEVVQEISKISGIDENIIFSELELSCRSMKPVASNLFELIARVRAKSIVSIATDNMDTFTRWTIPSLNLEKHFDGVLNS